ncbi:MAG TPA: mannosyltransferase family protein [Myxococcales bacterium]|nr:mannosyltransferase family protein [Myxococcales bacterium]
MLLRLRRRLGPRGWPVALVFAAFVASRAVAVGATHIGAAFMTPERAAMWEWRENRSDLFLGPPPPAFLAPLVRWDANYYLALARAGYPPPRADGGPVHHLAFFPLYGLVVREVARACGIFWAAFAVSNACTLAAALLLLRLGLWRRADGVRAAVLFLCSPGAHFFAYPYTEAMFAAALAATLVLLRCGRFLTAALPGAAASATRSPGVGAAVALFAHAVEARRLRPAMAGVLSLAGLAAFMAWCRSAHGDALAFVHMQALHQRHLTVLGPVRALFAFDTDPDYYLVTLVSIALVVWMVRRTPAWAWATAAFLTWLPLATGTMAAMIRYQAANVPLFCGAPGVLRGRRFWWTCAACLLLMALEAFLFGKGIGHY